MPRKPVVPGYGVHYPGTDYALIPLFPTIPTDCIKFVLTEPWLTTHTASRIRPLAGGSIFRHYFFKCKQSDILWTNNTFCFFLPHHEDFGNNPHNNGGRLRSRQNTFSAIRLLDYCILSSQIRCHSNAVMGLRVRYSCLPGASDLALQLKPRPQDLGWPIHGRNGCLLDRACIIPPKAPTARPDLFWPVIVTASSVWMGPSDLSVYIPMVCTPSTQEVAIAAPGLPSSQGLLRSSVFRGNQPTGTKDN